MTPEHEEMLVAGKITGAYGIKGWVKVYALTDPVTNFLAFERCYLRRRKNLEPVEFTDGRPHGKGLIAKLAGVDTRTDAELLRGTEVCVPSSMLPSLGDGEFYWHQLQGLQVWAEHEGSRLLYGVVDHLIETGANDVLVLRACEGSVDDRERLIPLVWDQVVESVDLDAGHMQVVWHPED